MPERASESDDDVVPIITNGCRLVSGARMRDSEENILDLLCDDAGIETFELYSDGLHTWSSSVQDVEQEPQLCNCRNLVIIPRHNRVW